MGKKFSEEDVLYLMQLREQSNFVYLDQEVDTEDGKNKTTIGDLIASPDPTPEELYAVKDTHDMLIKYIKKLRPREQSVITMYYGMDNETPMTLEAIGNIYGVSRERIRQVLNSATAKVKKYMIRDGIKSIRDI